MSYQAQPIRVLLVEDNPADARLISELLSEVPGRKFEILAVGSLREGLEHREQVDVVLLDLSLPDAHRLETVERMTSDEALVPVVVLTGLADEETAQRAMLLGAQDYLTKLEITPALLARTILYAIERKRAEENVVAAKSAWRAQVLAETSEVLARSLDQQTLAEQFVASLVPRLAEVATLTLLRGCDALQCVAFAAATDELAQSLGGGRLFGARHDAVCREACVTGRSYRLDPPEAPLPESSWAIVVPLPTPASALGALTLLFREHKRRSFEEERALAEDLARRAALALENARLYHTAQQAIRARDEVVAVVSHDLRNPLNVIGLALQALGAGRVENPAQSTVLARAQRAHLRMTRLLEDLLDITSIEQGSLRLERSRVNYATLLLELVDMQRPLAFEKGIRLELSLEGAELELEIDRDRIGQVLSNLLGNAIKFTPEGGTITVSAERSEQTVAVSVSDTGPGVPAELLPHVFDRFWQAKRMSKSGIGLGLAVAKALVEEHGGSIVAESEPGSGAQFRFELPIVSAHPRAERAAPRGGEHAPP